METWISPKKGAMTLERVIEDIEAYVAETSDFDYELRLGTDSQRHGRFYTFVTTIVIRRVGKGGRFFYCKSVRVGKMGFEERMWEEATRTLQLATTLAPILAEERIPLSSLHVDIDAGPNGKTSKLIPAIVGMITSYGFKADTKPCSLAASCVADKFVR